MTTPGERTRAADDLLTALQAAEVGVNEFGPMWNTGQMVAGLRRFYRAMGVADPAWVDPEGET